MRAKFPGGWLMVPLLVVVGLGATSPLPLVGAVKEGAAVP